MAIVVDNKDGNGNPGYRVKVKFPWLSEQESSFWARIAVPMGGSDRGTYVLPEIDDQLLVVFEHGDIARPIVIGTLWSRKQEPAEVNQSGKNNTKLIKSRCGHRIIFDDKEGAEKVTIVDQTKKNKIVLDSVNKTVKIECDGDIEVIAKTNVIMHSNALKIGTSESVTGKSKSLLVHAQKTFGLKATSGITIGGGSTTINVSNAAATSVSGSGSGELGGAAAETAKDQVEADERGDGSSGSGRTAGSSRSRAVAGSGTNNGPAVGDDGAGSDPAAVRADQIEVELLNPGGMPQRHVEFALTMPDSSRHSGDSAADGVIRVSGLTATGRAKLILPKVTVDDNRPADVIDQEIIPYRTAGVDVPIGQRSRVEIPTRAYRGRLTGMFFETDKAFLLPTAMPGIRGLTDYYTDHKGAPILVVGHTDTQGDNAYNLHLSVERADSIAAFLRDQVSQWMAWFSTERPIEKRWGAREVQHMLSALPDGQPPFLAPPVTGTDDARTKAAVSAFQQSINDQKGPTLTVDGNQANEATRRELVTAYMALEGTTLPTDIPTPATHGCGPFHNEVPTGPGVDEPRNRRVEMFIFDGEVSPAPKECKAPGCQEYQKWRDAVVETIDLDVAPIERKVTVTVEWPKELIDLLPKGITLKLEGGNVTAQEQLDSALVSDGMVRVEFHDLEQDQRYTLTAQGPSGTMELWNQQLVASDDDPLVWEHWLEDLIDVQDAPT